MNTTCATPRAAPTRPVVSMITPPQLHIVFQQEPDNKPPRHNFRKGSWVLGSAAVVLASVLLTGAKEIATTAKSVIVRLPAPVSPDYARYKWTGFYRNAPKKVQVPKPVKYVRS
jgi:hypothetical protein